jgi:small subunit ribosomal protein S27Ae
MVGGGKKKKKRVYTKPKKIKHKHKKVKLAVLKYYKVDSNDKVQRLRKACLNELCGAGTFMATHFNRYYCGKCSISHLITKEGDKK